MFFLKCDMLKTDLLETAFKKGLHIVCRAKRSLHPLVCVRIPINDFLVVLVTAGRKVALRGDTWQFRNDNRTIFAPRHLYKRKQLILRVEVCGFRAHEPLFAGTTRVTTI